MPVSKIDSNISKSSGSVTSKTSFKFISSTLPIEKKSSVNPRKRFFNDEDNGEDSDGLDSSEENDAKLIQATEDKQNTMQDPQKNNFNLDKFQSKSKCSYLAIILMAIFFRVLVGLHSFSGESSPPRFGDFEAQRHWMEITVNLPLKDWYRITENNDLSYWGLDYPPLSAYWAYLTGLL